MHVAAAAAAAAAVVVVVVVVVVVRSFVVMYNRFGIKVQRRHANTINAL